MPECSVYWHHGVPCVGILANRAPRGSSCWTVVNSGGGVCMCGGVWGLMRRPRWAEAAAAAAVICSNRGVFHDKRSLFACDRLFLHLLGLKLQRGRLSVLKKKKMFMVLIRKCWCCKCDLDDSHRLAWSCQLGLKHQTSKRNIKAQHRILLLLRSYQLKGHLNLKANSHYGFWQAKINSQRFDLKKPQLCVLVCVGWTESDDDPDDIINLTNPGLLAPRRAGFDCVSSKWKCICCWLNY